MDRVENLPVSYALHQEFRDDLRRFWGQRNLLIMDEVIRGPREEAEERIQRESGGQVRHSGVRGNGGGTFESINTLFIPGESGQEGRRISLSRELLEILQIAAKIGQRVFLCLITEKTENKLINRKRRYYREVAIDIESLSPDAVDERRTKTRRRIKFTITEYEWLPLYKAMWTRTGGHKGEIINKEVFRLDPYAPHFEEKPDPRRRRRRAEDLPPAVRGQRTTSGSVRYRDIHKSEIYNRLRGFRKAFLIAARAYGHALEEYENYDEV